MSPSESSEPLETALDELYGVEASEFVATRKRLAAELKTAGETAAAKELLTARRPTTTAWALNQLSRTEPALVETFLERSRDLEAAQTGELAGGRDALREVMREQRAALAEATEAAMNALGTRASESYRGQILATLHAASADPEVGEQLAQGRFIRELTGATGFLDAPGLTLVPDLAPPPPRKRPASGARTRGSEAGDDAGVGKVDKRAERAAAAQARADAEAKQRADRERAAAEAFARQVAEAEESAQVAEDAAQAAEADATAASQLVEQLERDLAAARRDVRATSERATSARRESARQARAATKLRSRGPRSS
jgi:hypothetical protein